MSTEGKLSVYELNALFAGRKMNVPYDEQIKLIGDELLKQGADVNVLPEFFDGLLGAGYMDRIPAGVGSAVSNAVESSSSVLSGTFNLVTSLIPSFGIPAIESVKSAANAGVSGLFSLIGGAIGALASGVASVATTLVKAVPVLADVIPGAGKIVEHGIEKAVDQALVKPLALLGITQVGAVPVDGIVNGDEGRLKDVVDYMNKAVGSAMYSYTLTGSTGTISKYKMLEVKGNGEAGGSSFILDYDKDGQVSAGDIHVDTIHANDASYAAALPRGATPDGISVGQVSTDPEVIKSVNLQSGRTAAIEKVMANHESQYSNLPHLIVGDFNEPSYLDWTEATKNQADHKGVVYPWDTSKALAAGGYTDAFRALYPDPVKNPGYTWGGPADNVGNVSWTTADDRDRIDLILSKGGKDFQLTAISSNVVGSDKYFVEGQIVNKGSGEDVLLEPAGPSISDHKGLLTVFKVAPVASEDVPVPLLGQPLAEVA